MVLHGSRSGLSSSFDTVFRGLDFNHLQMAHTTIRLLNGKVTTTLGRLTHRLAVFVSEDSAVATTDLLRRELSCIARVLQVTLFDIVERDGFCFLASREQDYVPMGEMLDQMTGRSANCSDCFRSTIALYHPGVWWDTQSARDALRWLRRSRILGVASVVIIVQNQSVPLIVNDLGDGLAREQVSV